jgi:predicted NUDIX family phosphoesterase|tara:strand:+ start:11672 stop:12181 length:510 start_codon:yes stop_codon:yes gene_type:complete
VNNDFEILANTVFVNEFDSDTDMATLSQISGWFENNIGELNTVLFTSFSGSGVDSTDEVRIVPSGAFSTEESGIFKQLYLKHFYRKKARNVLKAIDSSADFITLREGDSVITRTNKNEIAKTYRGFAKDAEEELQNLVYAYNFYQAKPRQVAGNEVRSVPVTGQGDNII